MIYTLFCLGGRDRSFLVDAGIDFNLPIPPLLRRDRAIDIIICLDASGPPEIDDCHALKGAKHWADARNIPFPSVPFGIQDSKCTVLSSPNPGSPVIVYLPLLGVDGDFCPRQLLGKEGLRALLILNIPLKKHVNWLN